MSKNTRPPLLIKEQFEPVFMALADDEAGMLFKAMMRYQWYEETPTDLPQKLLGMFLFVKSFADMDADKYQLKCEQNRLIAIKRHEKERQDKK